MSDSNGETPEQRRRRLELHAAIILELLPFLPQPRVVGGSEDLFPIHYPSLSPREMPTAVVPMGADSAAKRVAGLVLDVEALASFNLQPYIRVMLPPRKPSGINAEFALDLVEDPSQPGQYLDPLPCTVELSLTLPNKSEHSINLRVVPGRKTLPRETLELRRYSAGEESRWVVSVSVFAGDAPEDDNGR